MPIDSHRAKAFRVIIQRIDANDPAARPTTKAGQLGILKGLIARYDLQVGTSVSAATDDGKETTRTDAVVDTPGEVLLRARLMSFCSRYGVKGNRVFSEGSAALPKEALEKIDFEEGREPSAALRTSMQTDQTTAIRPESEHGFTKSPTIGGGDKTIYTGALDRDAATIPGISAPRTLDSGPKRPMNVHTQAQRDMDQQEIVSPPRPTPSDFTPSPNSVTFRDAATSPVISAILETFTSPATSATAITSTRQVTSAVPVSSTTRPMRSPSKRHLEDSTPQQRINKRPNNGMQRAVEAYPESTSTTRTFRSYPQNTPDITDAIDRIDNVHRHIQSATYHLLLHYNIDANTAMTLPSADPSAALEALYELAVGREGHGWASAAQDRFLAKDSLAFFFVSVLCAGVHKEIFAKPVPWETPHQFLERNSRYTSEASRWVEAISSNRQTSFEAAIFNAGATMIRMDGRPPIGEKSLHEEVIDPLAEKLGLRLFAILREMFQLQLDALAPTHDPEEERRTWSHVGSLLTRACREALMLRGLYETVHADVDITWVQPGTRFDVTTMRHLWGWRAGQARVEEPFEVTMSLTPMVTSEPGQEREMDGACWLKALVGIRPLNPLPKE